MRHSLRGNRRVQLDRLLRRNAHFRHLIGDIELELTGSGGVSLGHPACAGANEGSLAITCSSGPTLWFKSEQSPLNLQATKVKVEICGLQALTS